MKQKFSKIPGKEAITHEGKLEKAPKSCAELRAQGL